MGGQPRVGSFARWLAATVRARRITRGTLAQSLEVSGASLSRWVNGVELPSESRAQDIIDHVVLPPFSDVQPGNLDDPAWRAWHDDRAQGMRAWHDDRTARRLARSPEAAALAGHLAMLHAETRKAMRQLTVLDALIARLAVDYGADVDADTEVGPATRSEIDEVVVHDFVDLVHTILHRQVAAGDLTPKPSSAPIYIEIKRTAIPAGAEVDDE